MAFRVSMTLCLCLDIQALPLKPLTCDHHSHQTRSETDNLEQALLTITRQLRSRNCLENVKDWRCVIIVCQSLHGGCLARSQHMVVLGLPARVQACTFRPSNTQDCHEKLGARPLAHPYTTSSPSCTRRCCHSAVDCMLISS